MRFRPTLASILLLLPFAIACGTDCYDICDDAQDEGCSKFDHDECVHGCVSQEDFSDTSDKCDSKFDDLISCVADLSDVCDFASFYLSDPANMECDKEYEKYTTCVIDYCSTHETKDWCN
jgi:hypothetical protein